MMNANEARAKAQEAQARQEAEYTATVNHIIEEHIAPRIEEMAGQGQAFANVELPGIYFSRYNQAIRETLEAMGYGFKLWNSNRYVITVSWGE